MRLYKDTLRLMSKAITGEMLIPGFLPSIGRYRFRHEQTEDFLAQVRNQLSKMYLEEQTGIPTPSFDDSVVLFGPSHPVMLNPLRAIIQRDAKDEIGLLDDWLDPWNTQQYLENRWGFRVFWDTTQISYQHKKNPSLGGIATNPLILLDTTPQHRILWDPDLNILHHGEEVDVTAFFPQVSESSDNLLVFNSQPLAEHLIRHSVCFGEGPRFLKEKIDTAAQHFLRDLGLRAE